MTGYREDIDCPQCLQPNAACLATKCGTVRLDDIVFPTVGEPDVTPANADALAERNRVLRMDGTKPTYGQRLHPDSPLVLDRASLYALCRSLRLLHHQACDSAAYAFEAMVDDFEMMGLIHQLRSHDGDAVTILCDNAEGEPNNAVECNGEWTGYNDDRFEGDTLLDALREANKQREHSYAE